MRASVIVVTYNNRADLGPCLESIMAQLGKSDELIVVDNNSTDGSADMVRTVCPSVQLIVNENTGYAGGNNCGVQHASGEYLVFINPDTVLETGALDALLAPLEGSSDVALTTACIVLLDQPNVVNTCGNTIHYTGLTYCRGANQPKADYRVSEEVDAVSGAAFAIRRAVFEELCGFDERFFMYGEDADLSLRARLSGYRCLYVAEAVVKHDYQMTYSPSKAFYLDRNRHLMLLKNLAASTYTRMLPGLLICELMTWGFLLLQGPRYWGVKLQVYRWLWNHRHSISSTHRAALRKWRRADRDVVGKMTYRLDFSQLATRALARSAEIVLHPAFWIARLLLIGGRS